MGYGYNRFREYRKNRQAADESKIVGNFKLCRDKGLTVMQVQKLLELGYCFREILAGKFVKGKYIVNDMYDLVESARIEEKERLQLED